MVFGKTSGLLIFAMLLWAGSAVGAQSGGSCQAIAVLDELDGRNGGSSQEPISIQFSINGERLPTPNSRVVYVFDGLEGKSTFTARFNYAEKKDLVIKCGDGPLTYLEFNSYERTVKKVSEQRARALVDSQLNLYRTARFFSLEGEENDRLVKGAKKKLPRGRALATIYAGMNYNGKTDTLLAAQPAARVTRPSVTAATERLLAARAAKARSSVSKPAVVATAPASAARPSVKAKAETNRYAVAVIVGNRNYSTHNRDVPNVDYAHNDADQIYRYVIETLGYRDGNVILLKDATQADLVGTFGRDGNAEGKLYDWVRAGKSDVFVYYSGHGAPGLSNGQGYLLPVDSNPNKVELNGFPLKTLYENLSKIPAKSMTIVMDACFSGGSSGGSVVRNASSIALKRVEAKREMPSAAIFTATGLSEVASWDTEQQMGLFTRHFLEGIRGKADDKNFFGNGDGKVTVGELKEYLQEEVTYRARRMYGRNQNPQISGMDGKVLTKVR